MKVSHAEILEKMTWNQIFQLLVPKDEISLMEKDVTTFMNRRHGVSQCVLNAVLMKAIITAKRTHGIRTIINETYLRITFESFVLNEKRKIVIKTATQAAAKLDKEFDDLRQNGKIKRIKKNPEYVDQYLQELKDKDKQYDIEMTNHVNALKPTDPLPF